MISSIATTETENRLPRHADAEIRAERDMLLILAKTLGKPVDAVLAELRRLAAQD